MRQKIKILLIIIILIILNINVYTVNAAVQPLIKDLSEMRTQAEALAGKAGFDTGTSASSLGATIAVIIKAFLGLLGVIFVILIILAGYNWMTAAGEEEKVRKAKETIQRAIIGLAIILSAYAITHFVFTYMPWGGDTGP